MAFTYRKRSAEQINRRASGNDFISFISNEVDMYKPKKGANVIRFLPPTWEDPEPDHYGMDVWVHYNVGPDHASVLCLNRMKGERCPICEARARAERKGDEDTAGQLKATKRVLAWVIDRDNEDRNSKPLLFAMGARMDREIAGLSVDPRSKHVLYIDDPKNGYDVSFRKDGEGLKTQYGGIQIDRQPSEIVDEYLDYVEEVPIPQTLVWRSYEEVQRIFQGAGVSDAEAEEEAPPPRRPRFTSNGHANGNGHAASKDDDAAPFDTEPQTAQEAPPPAATANAGRTAAERLRARTARS